MRIARLHALAAVTLATGLLFSGAAFAGGAYGSAPPRVESSPLSAGTITPAHYKKRKVRRQNRNRQYRHHNRKRHVRSHRRHNNRFSYSFRFSPYYSSRGSYYDYDFYRPYGYGRGW